MSDLQLSFTWKLAGNFAVSAGLGEGAGADRLVRVDSTGRPFLPGDAVKGAIRAQAERLARWLKLPGQQEHSDQPHFPARGPLERIFRTNDKGRTYHFPPGVLAPVSQGSAFRLSSTAIDAATGVAKTETLRTLESWSAGIEFGVTISGIGGTWAERNSEDYWDAHFLAVAVAVTTAVGGHRSNGFGALEVFCFTCDPLADLPERIAQPDVVREMTEKLHLSAELAV